ncbi:MAG TPA: hypothetical protein VK162_03500 [Streptosporangiaceae bacterium]|nr:hypothetical protein [Streptosporangiaceae bacterium]
MSRRLLRLEIPVFPDRRMFRIHDATADADALGGPVPPSDGLVSSNREQLLVMSLQENVGVRVTIEEWDSAPPAFSDGYEDEGKCVLYLRGQLSVDMGTAGHAISGLRLAGGVGDYGVRVYARNRAEVVRLYGELFERDFDPLGDDFQQARKQLDGLEQYLLQFWREA